MHISCYNNKEKKKRLAQSFKETFHCLSEILNEFSIFFLSFFHYFLNFTTVDCLSAIAFNSIVHFTVACLVAKPLNKSEARDDLVLI